MAKWTAADIPDQSGSTILITGANSGLGLRSAEALSARGARVLMACRNQEKAAAALESVKAGAQGVEPEVVALDLSDLASVRDVGAELNERFELDRRAHQQRRDHGGAAGPDGRRVREPDGNQPPGALRTDRPVAPPAPGRAVTTRRHRVVDRTPDGSHPPRRPQLRASPLHPVGRVRTDEAGQPVVHIGAATSRDRGRLVPVGRRRPPGLRRDEPHRRPGDRRTGFLRPGPEGRGQHLRSERHHGCPAPALCRHHARRPRRRLLGPGRSGSNSAVTPTRVGRTRHARDATMAGRLWERSESLTGVSYMWS